jgi:hypothetical protein
MLHVAGRGVKRQLILGISWRLIVHVDDGVAPERSKTQPPCTSQAVAIGTLVVAKLHRPG